MGTYLSTPNLEKEAVSGTDVSCESTPVSWSACDMQGWRKNMEDSHIASTTVPPPPSTKETAKAAKVFAVFDGHGGREVALFVERHFVQELTKLEEYKSGDVGT